jgi:hypothetical protein
MIPPRRINEKLHRIDLNGYLFPWQHGQPALVMMQGSFDAFLPLFANTDALHTVMELAAVEYTAVKQIEDQREFIDSLPLYLAGCRLRIMVDPYRATNGRIRFKELIRETVV